MLKENWRLINRIEKTGDFVITALAFFLAYHLRRFYLPYFIAEPQKLAPLADYIPILAIAALSVYFFLEANRAYASMRMRSILQLFLVFTLASGFVLIVVATTSFLLKFEVSRSLMIVFCSLLAVLLTCQRVLVLKVLQYLRSKGFNYRNIIICGTNEQAIKLAAAVAQQKELGIRIRAYLNLRPQANQDFKASLLTHGLNAKIRIMQALLQLEDALRDYVVDEVIITDLQMYDQIEELIFLCHQQGIRVTIAADLFSQKLIKSNISFFSDIPLIHFQPPPGDSFALTLKRLFDLVLGGIIFLLALPIIVLIAVIIKLSEGGPVFFRQKRVGLNGRQFTLYKFRTMQVDAEAQLTALKTSNEMQGPAFKLENDPRVTKTGRILRKYSLDELPQLAHVIAGDMSLVGPRPPLPAEVADYQIFYRRRLSMRPGLTCLWQVSGRNKISDFAQWVALDLEYIDRWSLALDFKILLRTLPVVLFGKGS